MKSAVIVQARTGSTRLPSKMILPYIEKKCLAEVVLENLIQIFSKEKVILATTTNPNDDALETIATKMGVKCFRGDEDNVLDRFIKAAGENDLTHIVRVCADNPFVLQQPALNLWEYGHQSNADYIGYFFSSGLPSIKSHSGFFAEWVSVEALKRVSDLTQEKLYVEHVTNYIYANPELFTIEKMTIEDEDFCGKVRLTIDTQEDFNISTELFETFANFEEITVESLKDAVMKNPDYLERMQRVIQQQTK